MEKSKIILHEENCNEKDLEYVISLNRSYLLAQEQDAPVWLAECVRSPAKFRARCWAGGSWYSFSSRNRAT